MTEKIGSLKLSGILCESARIFAANFMLFVGLALLPGLADLASAMASVHPDPYAEPTAVHSLLDFLSYSLSFVLWVAGVVLYANSAAAICMATARIQMEEKVTIRSALSAVNPRAVRLIWVFVIQTIFSFWPMLFSFIMIYAIQDIESSSKYWAYTIACFALALGLIPSIAIFTRYQLAPTVCVLEDISPFSSIRRSIELGQGARWKLFWIFMIVFAPQLIISGILQWEIEQHRLSVLFFASSSVLYQALYKFPDVLASLFFLPLLYIACTLLYLQILKQKESFCVEDVLNGALATRQLKPFDDEESGPWDDAPYLEPEVGKDSVGMPWSIYGSRDALLYLQEEEDILEPGPSAAAAGLDSSQSDKASENQA